MTGPRDGKAWIVVVPDPQTRGARRLAREALYRLRFWGPWASVVVAWRLARAWALGRGDVLRAARAQGIPARTARSLRDAVEILRANRAERALASVTSRVRPSHLAALPGGWVNTHCGPLPRYAGLDAPFWCLYHAEAELAVTLHYMAEEFDSGPILSQRSIPNDGRPYFALVEELFELALEMHQRLLDEPSPTAETATPQDPTRRSYFGRPPVATGRAFRRRGGRFI